MIFVDSLPYKEWLEWRTLGLGGSDAAAIMGVSPFPGDTPLELWMRRTGRLEPKPDTFPMRRGRQLEPKARIEYEQVTGIPMPRQLGIHDDYPWLRGSFDGFNLEYLLPLEIKCPGKADHATACGDERKGIPGKIPEHYLWQLVHLMLVSGRPAMDYFSYDPKTTSALLTMERDPALEAEYLKKAVQLWTCIEKDIPPPQEAKATPLASAGVATKRDPFRVRRSHR